MRIERLEGNRKIRVLLSKDDLDEMNINIKTITPDSPDLHRFLFRIMEYIKRETGFVAEHGQVMVEASPQQDGVILTVTRIEQTRETGKRRLRTVRAKSKAVIPELYICRFYDFDAMCKYFSVADLSDEFCGKLFEYDGAFYLCSGMYPKYITEFAELTERGKSAELFLFEQAKLVAEGEELNKMIKNIKNMN